MSDQVKTPENLFSHNEAHLLFACWVILHVGAQWLSGRASDFGARGRGLKTYLCQVVSLSKTVYSTKVLVIPRKRWLHPDMTEKLMTWTLSINTPKSKHAFFFSVDFFQKNFFSERWIFQEYHQESKTVWIQIRHDKMTFEPRREKTGFLHMRKQRRRSASR